MPTVHAAGSSSSDVKPADKGKRKAKAALKTTGRIAEQVVLHVPLVNNAYNSLTPKPTSIPPENTFDSGSATHHIKADERDKISAATARRLALIGGHTAPLRFDIPPPVPPARLLDKAPALAVRLDAWKAAWIESSKERDRQILAIVEERASGFSSSLARDSEDTSISEPSVSENGSFQSGSDAQLEKKGKVERYLERRRVRKDEKELEKVVAAVMIASDGTHLANFGNAKAWPVYLGLGNLSKYIRGIPSNGALHHLAYLPSVSCPPFVLYRSFIKSAHSFPTQFPTLLLRSTQNGSNRRLTYLLIADVLISWSVTIRFINSYPDQ